MNSIFKKTVAVVLAVVMLMSVMSTAVFATIPWGQESTELVLDEQQTVNFEGGETKYFSFTPQKTGNYVFESFADIDVEAYLYDSQQNDVGLEQGGCDEGEGDNFRMEYYLTAGETYYLSVFCVAYDNYAIYAVPLMVTKGSKTVYDIKLDDITIEALRNGDFYHTYSKYYYEYHNWYKNIEFVTVVFSDESEQEYPLEFESEWSNRAWFEVGDKSYYIDFGYYYDEDFVGDTWLPGKTHTETVEWTYGEAEVDVTIAEPEEMDLSSITTFDYTYEDNDACYVIKPQESGLYKFQVEEDAYGRMIAFDKEFNEINTEYLSYDSGGKLNVYLKADETYYFSVQRLEIFEGDQGGTYSISAEITESTVESIDFRPISITEGTKCENRIDDENGKYYAYYWWNYLDYTVKFTDGCESTFRDDWICHDCGNVYEEYRLVIDKSYPSYENRWVAGETYDVTVQFMGEDYVVPVTIKESPVAEVEFEPIIVYEGLSEGYWTNRWDYETEENVEYFYYYWYPKYKITMADGEVIEGQGSGFNYEGDWFDFSYYDDQHNNHWKAGQNYTATVDFMGQTYEFPVTVAANPVKKIEIEPITVERIKDGYWSFYWDEENQQDVEYYRYKYEDKISYKITLTNDEVITGTALGTEDGAYIDFEGTRLHIDSEDTQHQNQWTIGNTYDAIIEVGSFEIPVKVTVKEPTFPKLVLNQDTSVTTIRGKNVYYEFTPSVNSTYYLESFSDSEVIDPYVYLYDENFNQIASDDDSRYDLDFKLECDLEAGKTYYFGIDGRNREETITVKLTKFESPIKSISFEPLKLIENVDGYYGEHEWFDYDYADKLTYTVTYKDGRTITKTGLGYWDEYLGQSVYMDWADDQHQQGWKVGNTYNATITVYGEKYTAPITIIADPIKKIEFNPITVEHLNGYWTEKWIWDEDEQEHVSAGEYYRYNYVDKIKTCEITLANGTTVTSNVMSGEYPYIVFEGKEYYLDWWDDQEEENWQVGGTYQVTVDVMGKNVPVSVTVNASNPTQLVLNKNETVTGPEIKYFAFTPAEDGTYAFESKGSSADPYVVICNSENREFGSSDDADNRNFKLICDLTAGQTYYFHIGFYGSSADSCVVKLTKLEEFIENIEFHDLKLYEGVNNRYPEGDLTERYYYQDKISYTITFKDGTEETFTGYSFEYDGQEYELDWEDSQWDEYWEAGNTYNVTVELLGKTYQFNVEVAESPVDYITVEPIIMSESDSYYDEDVGTVYRWRDLLSYTIYLKNGTEIKCSGDGYEFEGKKYPAWTDEEYPQWQDNWEVGNVYNVSVEVMGQWLDTQVSITEENYSDDGFCYLVQNEEAIITGVYYDFETLEIPEELGGYPVTAIVSLNGGTYKEVIIPDCVTKLSDGMFQDNESVEKITVGTGVEALNNKIFQDACALKEIVVDEANPEYKSLDGIVYDKDVTKMVAIPAAKETKHTVRATVTNIELYINGAYSFELEFEGENNTGYIWEDGILYNTDKTVIYSCDPEKTGEYEMPSTVKTISNGAFKNSALTSVTVSNSVKEIAYYAFVGSTELQKVVLPSTLTSISYGAFENCVNLTDVNIPSALKKLETRAFKNSGILSANIPLGVKEIGAEAFCGSDLEEVTLSEGLVAIGAAAFERSNITEVDLPDSLENIDAYAFYETNIKDIKFGPNLFEIGKLAFFDTKLEDVTIPDNVLMIGDGAFANTLIKNLKLSQNATYLSEGAFYNTDIQSVDIPDSVTDIAYRCFEDCENLMNIDLPSNLEALGYAFHGTKWYNSQPNGAVYLENAFYHYKGTSGNEVYIKNGTEIIAEYAFNNQKNLKTVYIPKSVKSIGDNAFFGCGDVVINYEGTRDDRAQMRIDDYETDQELTWNYSSCMHNWTNATCTAPKTCTLCGETQGTALGHKQVTVLGGKATLTANGSLLTKCSVCGHTLNATPIAKIASVTTTEKITYNGKTKKPAVTVKDANGKVIGSGNYTVKYASGRKNYGKYKITVTFKGNYSGTKSIYFEIVPKNSKVSKLTAAKKSLKVKIQKQKSASGYQIQYSTSKTFKSAKTVTLKKNSITSTTLKKLKPKKTYYVRVRTYKTYKGKKYYSAWSSAKSKKTK
ncbi:MAG: leucine-rich repeat domain-containing protein [Ruminococcaceae bacterium]|nr:leucine-rich repeat domain-containing protein [Oscillospiraceae bacterium]